MKDFDLTKVGKKMPYKIPDSFLDEFTYGSVRKSDKERKKISAKIKFWQISFAAASVALVLFTSMHFIMQSGIQKINVSDTNNVLIEKVINTKPADVETAIKDLSDEELKILTSMIESDIFNQ